MRIAAQAKLGFYPAPPEAVAQMLKHLDMPTAKREEVRILDPCAGEGAAIKQLATGLGIVNERVYCVELDRTRGQKILADLPGVNVLTPAGYLGTKIAVGSFSLAYVNPPFDNELGGGRREEQVFVERATFQLALKGILILVCPWRTISGNRSFVEFLDRFYSDIEVYRFPTEVRNYREVVLFGKRRDVELPMDALHQWGTLTKRGLNYRYGSDENLPILGSPAPRMWNHNGVPSNDLEENVRVWVLPRGWNPTVWKKSSYTEAELREKVQQSPLASLLSFVEPPPAARPPMPLNKGHIATLLAAGYLDGLVDTGTGCHVVRGTVRKQEFYNPEASRTEVNPETGATKTVEVFPERIVLTLRAVESDGKIYAFTDAPPDGEGDDDDIDDNDSGDARSGDTRSAESNSNGRSSSSGGYDYGKAPETDSTSEFVMTKLRRLLKKTEANGCTAAEAESARKLAETIAQENGINLETIQA